MDTNLPGDQTEATSSSPFDPATQQSFLKTAAETEGLQQGDRSWTDRIWDIPTKFAPLTVAAAANSFYNTGVEVANFFGADASKATIENEFGADSDYTQYYNQNIGAVEAAGLLAGSLIPGTLGIKALKLAQAGRFGSTISAVTGLMSGVSTDVLAAATADATAAGTGSTLFGMNRLNTIKGILAGAADQALQGAVYQTATLATMKASPLTDDNTVMENIGDIADAAKTFGLFGGVISGAQYYMKLKSAVRAADLSSKAQEAFGLAGKGTQTAGDRVVSLYDTLGNIPAPETPRAGMIANATKQTTHQAVSDVLTTAAGGDRSLAYAAKTAIDTALGNGLTPEQLANNLGSMTRIGRIDDAALTSKSSDVFYIPANIDENLVAGASHDHVMVSTPEGAAINSKAYQLASPTNLPTIARATDKAVLPSLEKGGVGTVYRPYAGAMDAYKNNIDIFVNENGRISVNPQSTAFKPVPHPGESRALSVTERKSITETGKLPTPSEGLEGVGTVWDTATGKFTQDTPVPVVGDLAEPKVLPRGLKVGDNYVFDHKPGEDFNPVETTPLEANSRYVWSGMRGIRNGDAIASNDLPMLEQLYREKVAGFEHPNLTEFTDGTAIPEDPHELLQHIADTKQGMLGDLMTAGKSSEEIERYLNTPNIGITKMFNSLNPDEIMSPLSQSQNIRHIRLAYDIGTVADSEGNLLRGLQGVNYRMSVARDINTDRVTSYLANTFGANQEQNTQLLSALQFTKGAGDADIIGAGKGLLANANGAYGSLAQQAERIGKVTTGLMERLKSRVNDTLTGALTPLRADLAAVAEWNNFNTIRWRTAENYVFLPDDIATANNLPANTAVLEKSLATDAKTSAVTWNKDYLPQGFQAGDAAGDGLKTYYSLSDKVAALEKASQSLNAANLSERSAFWKATGVNKTSPNPDVLYAPPINASKFPFVAYVRQAEGSVMGESGAHVLVGRDSAELQQKIAALGPEWDVFTKDNLAGYFRAKGEYDFNRSFGTGRVDSEMARKGLYNTIAPSTRPEQLDDLIDWHYRQAHQLLTDHVELHNTAVIDQLAAMGKRFDTVSTSAKGFIDQLTRTNVTNPYQSYIRTMLGMNPKDVAPLWNFAQEKLEAFGDTAFNTARAALGAVQKGIISAEDAAKMSRKFGLGDVYGEALGKLQDNYYGGLVNQLPPKQILSKVTAMGNTILHGTVIAWDTFQQLIHGVTLPIMVALEHSSATDELRALTSVKVPGTNQVVPGVTKTLYNAVSNFFQDQYGSGGGKLLDMYSGAANFTKDEFGIAKDVVNSLALPEGSLSPQGWLQKMQSGIDAGAKLSGANWMNKFIHFIAADVGRQIGESLGFEGQDLADHIGTFTNRVLGNVSAGQRAGIFQGPVGQALGLFQSYQWNMMQQVLRHVGEGDVKTLAMAAGMQSSIFGVSSLPGFQYLNTLLAERHGNTTGNDLYSASNSLLGRDAGDYLMYGTLSGLLGTSFYSRGDLNPRRATILPVNPLNFPSVQAGVHLYQTLEQLAQNISQQGGSVPASLLLAAEHNGLSRPLTGLVEMIQGYSTNSNGTKLLDTSPGMSELSAIANISRLLGARPLDESVAMDAAYRQASLEVKDRVRLDIAGEALKTAVRGNGGQLPENAVENTLSDYLKAGGNQVNFNKWFLRTIKDADTSVANKAMDNLRSPRAQYMQGMMGGVPLPDYRVSNPTETPQ
jgi:hypothetical protein